MKHKNNEIDMCHGPLLKKMVLFAIPLMLTVVLQCLFNTADLIVVGKFGREGALASVGATGPATNLFLNLFIGLSLGASVCVGKCYGANDNEALSKCVHTSVVISVIIGVTVGALGIILCKPLLLLMKTPSDILPDATLYMQIYFAGLPFTMLFNFCSSILRAVGDSKRCLIYISTSGVINVLLNLFFVIVFDMNVAGVALATIIAQGYSAFMAFRCFINYDGCLKVEWSKLKIYKKELGQILKIGIPSGIQSSLFSISNTILQSGINSFGTSVVSGSTAASNIEGYVYVAQKSLSDTAMSFAGQNYGARKFDRIKKVLLLSMLLSSGVGLVLGILTNIFSTPLLSLYTSIPEEISVGKLRLLCIALPYFICAIMDTLSGMLRGIYHPVSATILTVFGVCISRIAWIYTVFAHFGTYFSLCISYPVTWTITAIALFIMFLIVFNKEKREYENSLKEKQILQEDS